MTGANQLTDPVTLQTLSELRVYSRYSKPNTFTGTESVLYKKEDENNYSWNSTFSSRHV
jgi:hypothetical protein